MRTTKDDREGLLAVIERRKTPEGAITLGAELVRDLIRDVNAAAKVLWRIHDEECLRGNEPNNCELERCIAHGFLGEPGDHQ